MGFFRQFFQGRNGTDQLNIALLIAGLAVSMLGRFILPSVMNTLSMALLFLCIFRMLSRNVARRRQENALFLEKTKRFRRKGRVRKDRARYVYFKCPNCKQNLRAPRGKGKLKITCSKCGTAFQKTT